ncbi:hypothetical protein [Nocardia sp. NPDC049149]|uniref:hypothetical protein n=1 Tax=Nocardia sp. NPDC049149 TaxID=3364315 RepID=UPI0037101C66
MADIPAARHAVTSHGARAAHDLVAERALTSHGVHTAHRPATRYALITHSARAAHGTAAVRAVLPDVHGEVRQRLDAGRR